MRIMGVVLEVVTVNSQLRHHDATRNALNEPHEFLCEPAFVGLALFREGVSSLNHLQHLLARVLLYAIPWLCRLAALRTPPPTLSTLLRPFSGWLVPIRAFIVIAFKPFFIFMMVEKLRFRVDRSLPQPNYFILVILTLGEHHSLLSKHSWRLASVNDDLYPVKNTFTLDYAPAGFDVFLLLLKKRHLQILFKNLDLACNLDFKLLVFIIHVLPGLVAMELVPLVCGTFGVLFRHLHNRLIILLICLNLYHVLVLLLLSAFSLSRLTLRPV